MFTRLQRKFFKDIFEGFRAASGNAPGEIEVLDQAGGFLHSVPAGESGCSKNDKVQSRRLHFKHLTV